jgi:hypothetical protein
LWNLLVKIGKKQAKTVSTITGSISKQFSDFPFTVYLTPLSGFCSRLCRWNHPLPAGLFAEKPFSMDNGRSGGV